jgi:hypothetical protein
VGGSVQQAAYVLVAVRELEVSAPVLGTIVACGSLGGWPEPHLRAALPEC